jgi:glutamate-1-semialdehyde 2,1-aminomutase
VGAYGGKREIMERIAPCGDVYQAGTLSGNPVAMAAGVATLEALELANYEGLESRTKAFAGELAAIIRDKGVPVTLNTLASMFTLFFTEGPVTDFASAKTADGDKYASFYRQMRDAGIYLAPSGYECTMVSFAHDERDFEQALTAAKNVQF